MSVKILNAGSLPNIPWQDKPADLKTAAPVWRYTGNPVMGRNPTPEIARIFNSAVVPWEDGYIAVLRGEQVNGVPHVYLGHSKDGIHWDVEHNKVPFVDENGNPKMPHYAYDPRLVKVDDTYYIIWCTDFFGASIGMAKTKDFETFERVSIASEFGNRNGCLFPEKFDGLYCRFDRPFCNELEPCSMWVSFSPDLTFWGKSRPLMYKGKPWIDGFKMGAGAVPIKTDKGWLEIYHTVSQTCNGFIYRLKAALLSLDDPGEVIGYTKDFILWPEHDYEMKGRVMNVVFTCNALPQPDGTVRIYYGAADTNIGLATGRIDELVAACLENQ